MIDNPRPQSWFFIGLEQSDFHVNADDAEAAVLATKELFVSPPPYAQGIDHEIIELHELNTQQHALYHKIAPTLGAQTIFMTAYRNQ